MLTVVMERLLLLFRPTQQARCLNVESALILVGVRLLAASHKLLLQIVGTLHSLRGVQ